MPRLVLIALLVFGCSDADLPPEDCDPPLPATNDDGEPWPTYSLANAALAQCDPLDGSDRARGTCSDGKLFLERTEASTGDTQYFAGETLVGLRRNSDVAFSCDEYRFGDVECEVSSVDAIDCP